MSEKWVKDFRENELLSDHLLFVVDKATPMAKNNKQYMKLKLSDKTGIVESVMWDNVEKFSKLFEQGDYIKVSGIVNSYRGNKQLVLKYISKATESNIDMRQFVQASSFELESMVNTLFEYIKSIENSFLRELLNKIFSNKHIFNSYKLSPAGIRLHHAFLSGLLEHSLSVTSLCDHIIVHYESISVPVNRDLVIAGALLHDIGKIYELDHEKGFSYTTEGQLIGHVVLGYQLMTDISYQIENFPHKLRIHLGHIILSHQGRLEFGSPKTPMSIEAFIVHNVDEMDSKVNFIMNNVPQIDENNRTNVWTPYSKALDGYAINSDADLNIIMDFDIPERRNYLKEYDQINKVEKVNKTNKKTVKKSDKPIKQKSLF